MRERNKYAPMTICKKSDQIYAGQNDHKLPVN